MACEGSTKRGALCTSPRIIGDERGGSSISATAGHGCTSGGRCGCTGGGLLSPTGLWSAVVFDRTVDGKIQQVVDLTSHPDFAAPYALEWVAVAAALTAAAGRSERVIWFGTKPDEKEPRRYAGSLVPSYNNPESIGYYVPGSGYSGSNPIDLTLVDAKAQWLAGLVVAAGVGGYTVSLDGAKVHTGGLDVAGFGSRAGLWLLW